MKKLLAAFLAAAMLAGLTACSGFGVNDNPPMILPAADDRSI